MNCPIFHIYFLAQSNALHTSLQEITSLFPYLRFSSCSKNFIREGPKNKGYAFSQNSKYLFHFYPKSVCIYDNYSVLKLWGSCKDRTTATYSEVLSQNLGPGTGYFFYFLGWDGTKFTNAESTEWPIVQDPVDDELW